MPGKIKVLHIINGFGFGGAETWLLQIVKRNQGSHQFDFLLTGGVERELDAEFAQLGCTLHYLQFSGRRVVTFIKAFNNIVSREKYEVIHDHEDFVAGWHWLFLLFRLPGKRICHAHNSMIYINNYRKTTGRKFFYKTGKILNALLATHITGTSDSLMDELGYNRPIYKRKRIEPLYCGSEPSDFKYDEIIRKEARQYLEITNNDKLVVFIGRIGLTRENEINHKNPEFAFAIAKQLVKEDPFIKVVFVGVKGNLGAAFEEETEALHLENNIRFLGNRNDVNTILLASDLMLFTSTLEPFGLVLVEAQFSSLPIVASDIITKEIIVFPDLFKLLNVQKARVEEWTAAIQSVFRSGFPRLDFSKQHASAIDKSAFSIESSYRRLLKYYD